MDKRTFNDIAAKHHGSGKIIWSGFDKESRMNKESFDLFRNVMLAYGAYARAAQKEIGADGSNTPDIRLEKLMRLTPWNLRYEEAAQKYADHAGVSDEHYTKWLRQNPDEPSYYDRVLK
jgi:hypothetical protein